MKLNYQLSWNFKDSFLAFKSCLKLFVIHFRKGQNSHLSQNACQVKTIILIFSVPKSQNSHEEFLRFGSTFWTLYLSVFKTMSLQPSCFCSLHPRWPKWIVLFSHTVCNKACGELNPCNFLSKRVSISSAVRPLWLLVSFQSMSLGLLLFRFQRVACFF